MTAMDFVCTACGPFDYATCLLIDVVVSLVLGIVSTCLFGCICALRCEQYLISLDINDSEVKRVFIEYFERFCCSMYLLFPAMHTHCICVGASMHIANMWRCNNVCQFQVLVGSWPFNTARGGQFYVAKRRTQSV